MKTPRELLIVGLATVAFALPSDAADITWGSATAIAAASDIQSAGVTNLEGADFGLTNGTTTTVNNGSVNVAFKSLQYTQTVTLSNGITVDPNNFSFNANAGNGTIGGDYGAILGRHSGVFNNGGTIDLSGLAIGTKYQIQVFCMGGDTATVTISGSPGLAVGGGNNAGNSSGFGKYVVGTFTADALNQVLTLTANTTEPTINALTIGTVSGGGPDTDPPTWTATWPQVDPLSTTSLTVRANTNEAGNAYYVVLADGATAPNSAEVKAGTGNGGSAALANGSLSLSANTEATAPVGSLSPGTAYDVYCVAEDTATNLQASPVKVDASTLAPDLTPPTWTATWPKAEQLSATSLSVRAQTNENGAAYYVVLADGATPPNAAEVIAGTGNGGSAALASGNLPLTANTEATGPVTGLAPDTSYDVYFVAEDAVPNLQTSPVLVSVTLVTPVFSWGAWTAVSDETAIQTPAGYTYGGVNFNGSDTTIGSVAFTGIAQNGSGATNGVTVTSTGFAFQSTGSGNSNVVSAVGTPQTWATVLDRVIGDDNNSATIDLTGLTAGTDYTVQFFSSTPDGGINATTKITSEGVESPQFGSHTGGETRSIIASFTANSVSQSFSITGAEPTFGALVIGVESTNTFANWIGSYTGLNGLTAFGDDADFDGLDNGLENFLGTAPNAGNAGLTAGALSGNTFTFTHPQNATPASDVSAPVYTWSTDLLSWNASGASVGGITVDLAPSTNNPSAGTTTVTATVTGTVPSKLFVRLGVSQL